MAPATSTWRRNVLPHPATNGVARMAPMPSAALRTPKTHSSTTNTSSAKTTTSWKTGLSKKPSAATTITHAAMPADART